MIIVLVLLIVDIDIFDIDESFTLKQAKISSHWFEFQKIMKREFNSLIENEIWDLTFASFSQSILIDRWVFKIKKDRWDNILKFKTRWVVHDFKQKKDLDFIDIFFFVVKSMSWNIMMTIFVKCDYRIRQINVIITFLYKFSTRRCMFVSLHVWKMKLIEYVFWRRFSTIWSNSLVCDIKLFKIFFNSCFKKIETNHDFCVSIDKFIFVVVYINDLLFFKISMNSKWKMQCTVFEIAFKWLIWAMYRTI